MDVQGFVLVALEQQYVKQSCCQAFKICGKIRIYLFFKYLLCQTEIKLPFLSATATYLLCTSLIMCETIKKKKKFIF